MRVACAQLQAFDLERAHEAWEHALSMVERALAVRPDVVLLPECSYPAYYLARYHETPLIPFPQLVQSLARLARQGQCYLAAGLARPREFSPGGSGDAPGNACLGNSALMFSPAGEVVTVGDKHYLWHFDRRWFYPGRSPASVDTPWGRVGMFICADGRVPEIPRLLTIQGAVLQLDLTCWVAGAKDKSLLNNPQAEFVLRTRALENRCYMAAANKVGVESGRIVYCGRSQIISPRGEVLAQASSDQPEVIYADLPLPSLPPSPWEDFDPRTQRKPHTYRLIASPLADLPPAPTSPPGPFRLAVLQMYPQGDSAVAERWNVFRTALGTEGVAAYVTSPLTLVSPGLTLAPPARPLAATVPAAEPYPRLAIVGFRPTPSAPVQAVLIWPGYEQTVTLDLDPEHRVFDTPVGRVGVLLDREALLPEVPRVMALAGADWLAWTCQLPLELVELVARTRASENKVYVAAANSPGHSPIPWSGHSQCGGSLICDPDGRVLTQAFPDLEQSTGAQVHFALARAKTVVPGTDAIADRQPDVYVPLTV